MAPSYSPSEQSVGRGGEGEKTEENKNTYYNTQCTNALLYKYNTCMYTRVQKSISIAE